MADIEDLNAELDEERNTHGVSIPQEEISIPQEYVSSHVEDLLGNDDQQTRVSSSHEEDIK